MPDNLRPEDRQKTMRAVKSRRTGLERRLFAMLAGMRLRGWRTNVDRLPGKPDVVFETMKVAVFADGCFWHGCPYCQRPMPATNPDYWKRKIARNIAQASAVNQCLESAGWRVVRVWEHELKTASNREIVRKRIASALNRERAF